MKTGYKSTKDLIGTYIAARYNSFSNIYKVVDATPKSIELRECEWEGKFEEDPTWKNCHIKFENNKPKVKGGFFKKRVGFDDEGFVTLKDFAWNGSGKVYIVAQNDEEAKNYEFTQYWG